MRHLLAATLSCLLALPASAGPTLDRVRRDGVVRCAANGQIPGFSAPDSQGVWRGIDVDYCRAVAAAVLGDPEKVAFTPSTVAQRFTLLQSGQVDILARDTLMTLSRDTAIGLNFVGVNFMTGHSFLVRADSSVREPKQLDGASICYSAPSATETLVAEWARGAGVRYQPVAFQAFADARGAFFSGRCDAMAGLQADLSVVRVMNAPDPTAYRVLDGYLSQDAYGPMVARGDADWFAIARWVLLAQVRAEELGITRANIDSLAASTVPEIRRFLGSDDDMGKALGLEKDWAARVVRAVGNYGESYDRNFGPATQINLPRGANRLARDGGVHWAPWFQ